MRAFENEFTYKKFLESGNEAEFDGLFDSAVEEVKLEVLGKRFPIFISGKEFYSQEEIVEYSPIDRTTVIGRFQKGTREQTQKAIDSACSAFQDWRLTDYKKRAEIFRNAAKIFSRDKFPIAAILSIENGKSRYESIGEVDEAIDFLNYYSIDLEKNKGYLRKTSMQSSTAKVSSGFQGAPSSEEKVAIAMKPYGVFGVIAPFNFPVSISTGMSTGALITGNTVVFKPSSTDSMSMLTGLKIYEAFKDAGVPEGVFNYVTGPGSQVGEELVSNPKVSGIAFTGSKSTGLGMISRAYNSGQLKVFVVEMGGKNAVIVSQHADLAKAVSGVASAAFGFDGQKCSACSRVYVHESVMDKFLLMLIEKAKSLKAGDPLVKGNYMGPLINESALETYKKYVDVAKMSGRIVYGGNQVNPVPNGIYVEPVIAQLPYDSEIFHRELFLPFLAVAAYKRFDDAIAKANDSEYGLTSGLYSNKQSEIRRYMDKIEAGVLYVNREVSATTGAIVNLHTFVGWKGSGLTGKGSGSRFYLQQFMREQSQALVK